MEQLLDIVKNIKPFKIKCKGVTLKRDERANTYYIFLNIVEGKEIINQIILLKKLKNARVGERANFQNFENINLKKFSKIQIIKIILNLIK